MAAFGKLSNALVHATQENTVALAHLNFDFSIIKYEAPTEYKGLGTSLSQRRIEAAEDGMIHSTARRLGALFESEIPEVPELIEAYGRRVSEIASMPTANSKGSKAHGAFMDYVGVDGTTIWASATSGKGVVTIHLLACMLARVWKGPQAISIWSELVEHRKSLLAEKVANSIAFQASDMAASRIVIARDQLADWDAGARSWLSSADKAKAFQQTQLRLILDNISLPVSKKPELYPAVIETWKKAMTALNDLILGRPQRIQSGDVLLGISAWHLYPDMSVLRDTPQYIAQRDDLISSGGIITIGLEGRPDEAGDGIYWSLPLAHMRYYGDATIATRFAGLRESQVSFGEFRYVILGSILATWGPSDLECASRLICLLANSIPPLPPQRPHGKQMTSPGWLHSLADTCGAMSRGTDEERNKQSSLIGFGRRKCADFLCHRDSHPCPVFGLTNFEVLLGCIPGGSRARIKFLRTWAHMTLDRDIFKYAVIRYRGEDRGAFEGYHYTNVFSKSHVTKKRSRAIEHGKAGFFHWRAEDLKSKVPAGVLRASVHDLLEKRYKKFSAVDQDSLDRGEELDLSDEEDVYEAAANRRFPPGPGETEIEFEFICGDAQNIAIFRPISGQSIHSPPTANEIAADDLLAFLEKKHLDPLTVAMVLLSHNHVLKFRPYFDALEALYTVEQFYAQLDGATVDLQITSRSVAEANWAYTSRYVGFPTSSSETDGLGTRLIRAFSLIAIFEAGFPEVDPRKLDGVIALSYNNSLYVATYLLEDPADADKSMKSPVTRVIGNIGKPGLSFIITPANPKIRQIDYTLWRVVEHNICDGMPGDYFTSTSLHLSFTGYELPLDIGARGSRDSEVFFIEAAISVHEGGKWVADLDAIAAQGQLHGSSLANCPHNEDERKEYPHHLKLLSVDNWAELLELPNKSCVLRANKNLVARFAAATLCIQKNFISRIIGPNLCWQCVLASSVPPPTSAMPLSTDVGPDMNLSTATPPQAESDSDTNHSSNEESVASWLDMEVDPLFPDMEVLQQERVSGDIFLAYNPVVFIW
ncbi:hypothetical protein K469DRAFT_753525 [Zopfia rhizophila CBS 207.26]|uniref:Uncharacterized protein n=1 Tax=Zopfia rhizophila CBS 207.26 TaxID=1314779 RepID=A0A6A6DQ25_9PEZI|nr:hypothetical protein K469DRAFT_753525 [Zopfia rhizophila CBS 207.26]